MPKFTGGKWHVSEENLHDYVNYFVRNDSIDICSVWTECLEDARLIASAPDMYNLLKAMTSRTCNNCRDFKKQAKELLKSIDGEDSNA